MIISNLKDEPHHLATLAEWHHNEWAHLNPDGSLEKRMAYMENFLSEAAIPTTFICTYQGELAGSCAIIQNDMETHQELSPWLASVFVKPAFRKKGIGYKLVQKAMEHVAQLHQDSLYLFTEDQEALYSALGWQEIFKEIYHGADVTVMRATL